MALGANFLGDKKVQLWFYTDQLVLDAALCQII